MKSVNDLSLSGNDFETIPLNFGPSKNKRISNRNKTFVTPLPLPLPLKTPNILKKLRTVTKLKINNDGTSHITGCFKKDLTYSEVIVIAIFNNIMYYFQVVNVSLDNDISSYIKII